MPIVAALVKYNPCSIHTRGGAPCPFFAYGKLCKKPLGRASRLLLKKLDMKIYPVHPRDWITRFTKDLGLQKETLQIALDLAKTKEFQMRLSGKSYLSISATAVYLASLRTKEKLKTKKIAGTFGVTSATIQNLVERWQTSKNVHKH